MPEDKIAYVDETGIDKYLYREYGRAKRGLRVYGTVRGRRFQRTGIVAAKVGKNIAEPFQYHGTMHHEFFENWFEKHLIPSLPEDVVIVMDNASFHRKSKLYELAKQYNRKIIFLPPYSPELNPIEHFWFVLKRKVSDLLLTFYDLDQAIAEAF